MGKVVLVTGSSKGIGRAIATLLAKNKYDVVINYLHSEDEAFKLRDDLIKEYGINVLAIKADVANEDDVNNMFNEIESKLNGVDILINNAGIDLSNMFNEKTIDEFKRTLDVNVIGAYNTSRRAYEYMKKNNYGRIINISSTNGINTYYPMSIDYDASKAALISLTHNLAIEFAPSVHVNAIAPGFIGTENELNGYDEEFLKEETSKILLNRYGTPDDVANLVKYLISDDANYINNTVIRIDGGQKGSY